MRWFRNEVTEWGGEEQFLWLLLLQDWLAGWLADDPAAAGMLLGHRTGRRGGWSLSSTAKLGPFL